MIKLTKPRIIAKASLDKAQIEAKLRLGADAIELQLLGESLDTHNDKREWTKFEKVYDIPGIMDYPVDAIHAPLITGCGDITIENMLDIEDNAILHHMFQLAESYGKRQTKSVTLVVHSETYYANMLDVGNIYKQLKNQLRVLLGKHQHVQVAIENVSPVRNIKNKNLHLSNNFGYDNVELVTALRKDLNSNRIGTILDTCHAMLTEKYIKAIYDAAGEYESLDYSLAEFAKQNREVISHIHFADMKGSGYGAGRHGIPFTENTKQKAFEILDLFYKQNNYSCPLCLEVEEKDGYELCTGFQSTLQCVNEYFSG